MSTLPSPLRAGTSASARQTTRRLAHRNTVNTRCSRVMRAFSNPYSGAPSSGYVELERRCTLGRRFLRERLSLSGPKLCFKCVTAE